MLLIFDFDGTLADSGPWVAGVLNEVAARYGFNRLTREEMAELRAADTRTVLRRLAIPAWRLPALARHMRARMAREIDAIPLFDGVGEALDALAGSGAAMAVASSNSEANVRRVLGARTRHFRWFECGTSLFGKAARFRRVLARAGATPAQALCIGDEVRDAEAARKAGIAFAAVAWGYNTPDVLRACRPALFFHTPADLRRAEDACRSPDDVEPSGR